ncbi:hypothetical protein CRUP_037979 [Coryphaenoides rupestris]|nr:hypothetical protein CRUP_037979 [Coryphaenoides rupestris]
MASFGWKRKRRREALLEDCGAKSDRLKGEEVWTAIMATTSTHHHPPPPPPPPPPSLERPGRSNTWV